jgi:2-dehydropantoate 2-reductase
MWRAGFVDVRIGEVEDWRVRFAIVGSGAVGGFYGALLARSGHDVAFVARGAHLDAIRARGLRVVGPLGDFTARGAAERDPARIGPVDAVIFAVKTYDNATALPLLAPLAAAETTVLTLQNGVDSAEEVAAAVGEARTLAGATYIATAIESPGVIRQTGTHRRIVFGECFGSAPGLSARVRTLETVMKAADIQAEAVADARPAVWEKFTYLAPFAGFTGATRLPVGPIWQDAYCRALFLDAVAEVVAVARAHGIEVPVDYRERVERYAAALPPDTRSSLLIDLLQGKRIEVEALQGSVVRRGRTAGVPTPIMAVLYAVLRPHAGGAAAGSRVSLA